jgi:ligand-binding sensor domain-containing protein
MAHFGLEPETMAFPASMARRGGGATQFDGEKWTTYTTTDGLAGNWVYVITVAPDGTLWFGTDGGASHFDGDSWTNYTTKDGLPGNNIRAITIAPDGAIWFAGAGVARYSQP